MFIKLKEKNGKKLKTAGTACAEDINIIPVLQEKKVDGNGTYTADDEYVGISKIIVDVENEPYIPDGYIQPSGTKDISINGTHNVKDFEFAKVDIALAGETRIISKGDTITIEVASVAIEDDNIIRIGG